MAKSDIAIKQWLRNKTRFAESQSYVNYAMPVRNMLYDSLAYIDQARAVWETLCDNEKMSQI